jgi:hypothetical protein
VFPITKELSFFLFFGLFFLADPAFGMKSRYLCRANQFGRPEKAIFPRQQRS